MYIFAIESFLFPLSHPAKEEVIRLMAATLASIIFRMSHAAALARAELIVKGMTLIIATLNEGNRNQGIQPLVPFCHHHARLVVQGSSQVINWAGPTPLLPEMEARAFFKAAECCHELLTWRKT